jgi:hypothetical protein
MIIITMPMAIADIAILIIGADMLLLFPLEDISLRAIKYSMFKWSFLCYVPKIRILKAIYQLGIQINADPATYEQISVRFHQCKPLRNYEFCAATASVFIIMVL